MGSSFAKAGLLLVGFNMSSISLADFITPAEPEAYESFVLEIDVPDFYGYRAPHLNVEDQEIFVLHDNTIPHMGFPGPERPIIIEVQGLPPGTYAIKELLSGRWFLPVEPARLAPIPFGGCSITA